MKKVIAIMMVLAIVAGAVFAAVGDSQGHTLTVKTVVDEKLPAFQLRFSGSTITEATVQGRTTYTINNDSADVATNDVATDGDGETFVDKADSYTDSADPVYVGFDLGVEGTYPVHFFAYLVQNGEGYYAKTYKSFTLEFSDGRFDDLKVRGDDIDDVTKGDPTISVAPGTELTTGGTITASGDTATIVFNGQTCPSHEVMVADATYTWTGIKDLDMGAYTADIVLTITNTN